VASLRAALSKAQANAASASANKKLESELKSARAEAEKSRRALAELQGKHSALVMAHVELEETLAPLQSERETLKRDAQMAEVFQQGLTDLRGMLEKEIDEKNKIQQAWEDLQHTSKKSVGQQCAHIQLQCMHRVLLCWSRG
jgi:chromosome segregation ATPase